MKLKTFKEFDLKPIKQKVRFQWTKRKGRKPGVTYIYIGSLGLHESYDITEEDKRELMKLMKQGETDVLTDGYHYYTYSGCGKNQHSLRKISSMELSNNL